MCKVCEEYENNPLSFYIDGVTCDDCGRQQYHNEFVVNAVRGELKRKAGSKGNDVPRLLDNTATRGTSSAQDLLDIPSYDWQAIANEQAEADQQARNRGSVDRTAMEAQSGEMLEIPTFL